MLELQNVETFYGERQALFGVSLAVPKGAVVGMLGRNGMGKTTIIRTIMGINPPRRGSVRLNGREIAGLEPDRIARLGIGFVPQGRGIFPSLSVKENLTIAERRNEDGTGWTLEKVYDAFPILKKRQRQYGNLLSGGEQQMLSIARALMTNPDTLLMDEPSEGLAPMVVNDISVIIRELKASHSVLLAEQHMNMALAVADYIYIINKGTVVHESSPEELSNNVDICRRFLGVC
ncbi:MAG: ABC transporter ATP-binding protein [Actinobacteria bacterium]|nr:ABC transporter ATP-binding protein [Actinomycetota bacterium]